ncbi:DUF2127 domain-containing protein [Gulosibacter molinativorax]|uniref:DUF2127 domain-containing protein n=1 Tax=Gulosibacter molinativorax TaxID=256821 RepID=UPI0011B26EDE|nr:DUF2127 domain-containing protein [Gulosibacter molinativorax]QUY62428.1 Putative integral membrane protein [Gulosibacter molinativorax]
MPARTSRSSAHIKLKWAAWLQLVQGVLMEGLPFLGLFVLLALDVDAGMLSRGFSFIVPFFDDHLYLMMAISGVFAALRVVGAVGVLRNRMWGYSLSVINCSVTIALMIFMLPAGILDGLLSGTALVLLLMARHASAPILEQR